MSSERPARIATASRQSFFRSPLPALAVLALGAALAYANSFGGPFVFDDELAIVANPSLHRLATSWHPPADLTGLPISGRPVVNFSFALSYAISGSAVWSYHLLNLLIHFVAGALLFDLVRRTLLRPALAPRFGAHAGELALSIAALWTLHPLQTESVTYISQRAEALLGVLYLLTCWSYVRAAEPGAARGWAWLAVAACALGMMTKEVMASAPLFVALYDRAALARSWRGTWTQRRRLLLALAGTWLVLAWVVAGENGARGQSAGFGLGVSPWSYLLTQCDAIVLYLKLAFWPHPLVLDYGTGLANSLGVVWWQAALLVALFAGTLWALVRRPMLGCLGAAFFMILAPSSSIVPLVGQTMAEHRMYLPLAAVVTVAASALYLVLQRRALVLLAAAAIVCGLLTARRNEDYATAIRICEDTVAKRPDNARAMALLADYHRRAGDLDRARQWLERSLAVQPGIVPVLNNLGDVWQALGRPAEAAACFREVLARRPHDAAALNNLGNALVLSGRVDEGIATLQQALQAAPPASAPATRANLANALAQNGHAAEAAPLFEALLAANPSDAEAHYSFAGVLLTLGRRDDAIAHAEQAVRLAPQNAEMHNRLGFALARAGRVREALPQFQEALRLDPNNASARQNAARAARLLTPN